MLVNAYSSHTFGASLFSGQNANAMRVSTLKNGAEESQTFAEELTRRIAGSNQELGGRETKPLADSLARTVEYVRGELGDEAATAAIAIFASHAPASASDQADEQDLGGAMLALIRFVDKNFGVQEGDKLVNSLNSDLNQAVNDFFQNGLNERIYASTTPLGQNSIASTLAQNIQSETADTNTSLLDSLIPEEAQIPTTLDQLRQSTEYTPYPIPPEASGLLVDTLV